MLQLFATILLQGINYDLESTNHCSISAPYFEAESAPLRTLNSKHFWGARACLQTPSTSCFTALLP